MAKYGITILSIVSFVFCTPGEMVVKKVAGEGSNQNKPEGMKCISEQERSYVRERILQLEQESMRDTVLFQDPMGNGGMVNDDVHDISGYVDENPAYGWILDYTCNFVTYDGHLGTDMAIGGFYYMDEMTTPILAVAPGIVTYTHDGEFDRWTYWNNSAVGNAVIVLHSDGTSVWYWHMKKNSVAVATGDTVETGDTLGFVGSSGFSSGPHLHFEVESASGTIIDPWEGDCSVGPSRWVEQTPFIGDTLFHPQKLLTHIPISYPIQTNDDFTYIISENIPSIKHINPGDDYISWLRIRNLSVTDTMRWEWYRDGEFFYQYWWIPGNSNYWYQGVEYFTTSIWYFYGTWFTGDAGLGEWTEKVFINGDLLGEKTIIADNIPNQPPSVDFQQIEVELGQTVTGEFTATDDGDPFWFNLESEPNNGGNIDLFGGRRRKFEYTAPMDYNGFDVMGISATDDRGETGPMALILFDVYGTGLTNMVVEPSFIAFGQDSVFIGTEVLGGNDEISVQALIHNTTSGETVGIDLVDNDVDWTAHWSPESESFFSVDLQLVNGAENDTVYYESVGHFTSVGPVSVNMVGDLIAYPGDGIALDFIVENNSANQAAPDISVLFEAASMNCLSNISQNSIYLGDIAAGESVSSIPNFFVALLNDECNSDSTILINIHVYSGENIYWYDDFTLNIEMLGTISGEELPNAYALGGAYPNPFNPNARIDYALVQKNYVALDVHNLIGRKVKTLVSSEKEAGFYSTHWDATNDAGEPVSAGVYLYTIQAGEFRQTKKMILLK